MQAHILQAASAWYREALKEYKKGLEKIELHKRQLHRAILHTMIAISFHAMYD